MRQRLSSSSRLILHACLLQVDIHTVTLDLQDTAKVEALVDGLPDNFQEVGTPSTHCC